MEQECHLVVFVHGLWGITAHFDSIISCLVQSYPNATELFESQYYHKRKDYKRSDLDLGGESFVDAEASSFIEFKYKPKSFNENALGNENILPPSNSTQLIIYRAHGNEKYFTYDGIDVCGTRVAEEIDNAIDHLQSSAAPGSEFSRRQVTKISIVGYSLGGLISRYAIGLLYSKGLFDTIQPFLFTTFCSPHVGVIALGSGISAKLYNWLVPRVLGTTGRQLFLLDYNSIPYGSTPLLVAMAQENSSFYKGLSMFSKRVIYSNIVNDIRTSWCTASIELNDPWEYYGLNKLCPVYVKDYSPVVINGNISPTVIEPKDSEAANEEVSTFEEKTENCVNVNNKYVASDSTSGVNDEPDELPPSFWTRKLKWLLVLYKLVFLVPYFALTVLGSGIYHGWLSYRRQIRFKESHSWLIGGEDEILQRLLGIRVDDNFDDDISDSLKGDRSDTDSNYSDISEVNHENGHMSHWSDFANDAADDVMNSVLDAISFGELPGDRDLSNRITLSNGISLKSHSAIAGEVHNEKNNSEITNPQHQDVSYFKQSYIDMYNSSELFIFGSLNKLSWTKYGVHITKTKMAHAAAIVRHKERGGLFDEGFLVIKHWINEEVTI
ncbi:DUF676-domain-containing protein [Nadsonia fulvescens var. elongata DSM 6958]|uniref:DUF676-domain-containing protein n=1 Tax=Nadsonia fulvescens var. elongata DSM 6958 TaxID=857566 RepID=A0A1E3PF13_9ASCO|nr:DUF676-domain-containing protein [Nadsonia fulvescens var. elongata DSM 6958]